MWPQVAALSRLQRLTLCGLEANEADLDRALSALTSLTALHLRDVRARFVPACLPALQRLQVLQLTAGSPHGEDLDVPASLRRLALHADVVGASANTRALSGLPALQELVVYTTARRHYLTPAAADADAEAAAAAGRRVKQTARKSTYARAAPGRLGQPSPEALVLEWAARARPPTLRRLAIYADRPLHQLDSQFEQDFEGPLRAHAAELRLPPELAELRDVRPGALGEF